MVTIRLHKGLQTGRRHDISGLSMYYLTMCHKKWGNRDTRSLHNAAWSIMPYLITCSRLRQLQSNFWKKSLIHLKECDQLGENENKLWRFQLHLTRISVVTKKLYNFNILIEGVSHSLSRNINVIFHPKNKKLFVNNNNKCIYLKLYLNAFTHIYSSYYYEVNLLNNIFTIYFTFIIYITNYYNSITLFLY